MQLTATEDIAAPIGDVFDMLSEFESFERLAIRRGIDVQRLNDHSRPAQGLEWCAVFDIRGKPRDLNVTLNAYERPNLMRFVSTTRGYDGAVLVELLVLSPRRTRLNLTLKIRPNSLTARMFVQSLKLARRNLNRRLRAKLAALAQDIENRHARRA